MKNIYKIWFVFILFITGCSDFTEIDPKGKNTLSRVEDLNLVLNYTYSFRNTNILNLVGDVYPQMTNIPTLLNDTIQTLDGICTIWDEAADRAVLTESDTKYTNLYAIIGRVANPVLLNVDHAEGDQILAAQLKAEALVLRAWCHYMAVNLYAKAYDPATAETDPGIVYSKETDDIAVPNEQLSVAEIYTLILEDLEQALALESLPVMANKMRVGLPFAYAVQAKVLMSMHDYDGAFAAAEESLKLKNTIDDYNELLAVDVLF
ncbi:MAG: RagB/SusD family nutrient uptake outer membrane protein, partial [Bacteroidales bacterium]|nr:RagB/SusD family nutrient uptake outer membrane protein [Bacteroidales bacterium]